MRVRLTCSVPGTPPLTLHPLCPSVWILTRTCLVETQLCGRPSCPLLEERLVVKNARPWGQLPETLQILPLWEPPGTLEAICCEVPGQPPPLAFTPAVLGAGCLGFRLL